MLARRTIVAQALLRTVDKALDVAGGSSFYRGAQLERHFRDIQAARYHPYPEKVQLRLSGRLALVSIWTLAARSSKDSHPVAARRLDELGVLCDCNQGTTVLRSSAASSIIGKWLPP